MPAQHPYLLDDTNFERDASTGQPVDSRLGMFVGEGTRAPGSGKMIGHALAIPPFEARTAINVTSPPGGTAGIYISLMFQLVKWEYQGVIKVDEWIEVNPTYAQYYQLTLKQKEDLEGRIKAGLASVSQSIADLELLKHDERKYREFLEYLGWAYNGGRWTENLKLRDEHALKAVFIDLVDAHTGEGIAMRNIVSRWPTLIVDFMAMDDNDMDPDKLKDKVNVSKAEATVLVTKNKLYGKWKSIFLPELKVRYQRIEELIKSREKSVDSYREWLSPYIARHKLIAEGLQGPGGREWHQRTYMYNIGLASSFSETDIWAWREFQPVEIFRGAGSERVAIEIAEGRIDPYDDWTKRNLIFHPVWGLKQKHGWITHEWCQNIRNKVFNPVLMGRRYLIPHKLYYTFFIIKFLRANVRMASGAEIEDSVFDVNAIYMSQNCVFVKILENEAKKAEFEHYIDSLLGITNVKCPICTPVGKAPEYKENKAAQKVRAGMEYFGLNFQLMKGGPYERDFDERITKLHLAGMAAHRYLPIVQFIKQKIGMGVS